MSDGTEVSLWDSKLNRKMVASSLILATGLLGYLVLLYPGWSGSESQILISVMLGIGMVAALLWVFTWDSMKNDLYQYPFALYR